MPPSTPAAPSAQPISVVLVDDHPIVRAGMRTVLAAEADLHLVAEGADGEQALALVSQHHPDVLVLDINLPGFNGIEVTRRLCSQGVSTAILILTVHDDPETIFSLLECGATGYVLKDEALETLAQAVRAAARRQPWLSPAIANHVLQRALHPSPIPPAAAASQPTPVGTGRGERLTAREIEVLALLAQGLDNSAIASRLVVTMRTVQNHVSNIYGKLGVASRTEAALYAIQHGLAQFPSSTDQPSTKP
ncbi:MAG: response regulator transcription factor [Anaerolineales bacterium]|nr:response regulator transcription factor [Anaerolineales bacterium]